MFVDKKTLRDLEWHTILKHLSGQAYTELGKRLCLELLPSSDIDDVKDSLALTTEAKKILQMGLTPPFGGIYNISEYLKSTKINATLEYKNYIDIASTLMATSKLKSFFNKNEEQYPLTAKIAGNIIDTSRLIDQINRIFDDNGGMKDTASPQLKQLKDRLRDQTSNLKESLNRILKSSNTVKFLQDPVFTIRNDRYVLPVKAEYKSNVPGIVHDSSASGVTIFIEPREIVELNNKIRETELKIDHEINRILADLTQKIAQEAEKIFINLDLVAELDFIFAKARYSKVLDAGEPQINENKEIFLKMARHPILIKTIKNVVSNTVNIGKDFNTLIITGANTGGKTVMLKTMGVCILMAGAGMHIPAESDSSIYLYSSVFSNIGEEQSLENNLSTFSAHMSYIINIVNKANSGSLVLLDELGAGTDPTEGTALAQALLEDLNNKNANTVVTTHYGGLKTLAYSHKGFFNASVEFDIESLRPTYKLLMGIPGKSNATTIAKNLGLSEEAANRAREIYTSQADDFSLMLDDLQNLQREASKELEKAQIIRQEANKLKDTYEEQLSKINSTKSQSINTFRKNLEHEYNKAKSEVINILEELKKQKTEKDSKKAHSELSKLQYNSRKQIEKHREELKKKDTPIPVNWNTAQLGDKVIVKKLNQEAEILSLPDNQNRVVVQMGLMKSTVKTTDLIVSKHKTNKQDSFSPKFKVDGSVTKRSARRELELTLDLRGKTVNDSLSELEIYLDQAALGNISPISIIHGHGTGALRSAVREYLKESPYVKSFRPGDDSEGGDGISIVEIK